MDQNLDPTAITLTKTLCAHLAAAQFSDLSAAAQREARRGVLDWVGCALAGSRHKTSDTLLALLREIGGRPQATVLGRAFRLGRLDAPLANGQMGHVLDFDDTHMGGVVLHASSPILAALFSLAERSPVSGADLMLAYAAGFEAGIRSGLTAPGHHKGGWHLTGTLGTIAAAVAGGKLIGLDAQKLTYAMGIAATQAAGVQSKLPAVHSAAVALVDGAAGIAQYSDARATDPVVAALRCKTKAIADATLGSDEAYAAIVAGGKRHEAQIPHATGTAANPMSDAAIQAKFRANATPVIGGKRAQSVVEFVWTLERQRDVRDLIALLA